MKNALKNRQSGFSMIEVIVVMAVMLVVLAAVFSLMRGTISTASANFEMTTAAQGLRNSQEFLTRDILLAGDGMKGIANIWLPTAFVTSNLTSRTAVDLDPTNLGFVNTGMTISDDNVPAGTVVNHVTPARSVLPNTDRLTVLTRDPTFSPIDIAAGGVNYSSGQISIPPARMGDFGVGEIYFLSNGVSGVFGTVTNIDGAGGRIVWADGDPWGLNRVGPTGQLASVTNYGTYPVVLKRIQIVNYYIDDQNRLTRRVFGVKGGGLVDNVIAEHVRTIQFRYVLKPSDPAMIFDQPKTQITTGESVLVRTIEPSIIVETAHPLQDGEIHDVEGFIAIGVRNLQFNDALVPRDSEGNTDLPDPGPTPVITPTPPPPTPPPTPPPPTPTPTATPSPSPTGTPWPTPVPTPTVSPTPPPATPTPPPTPVPTPTPSGT